MHSPQLCTLLYFLSVVQAIPFEKPAHWFRLAAGDLQDAISRKVINGRAKNVILFLGDGMGLSTVTASRIYNGQEVLKHESGVEGYLEFERWPNIALMKTYNVDYMVPDSAGTATAYLTGVKAQLGTIGVNAEVSVRNCRSYKPEHDATSILMHSLNQQKSGGVVTTTTLTHATPSASYAHSPFREWVTDTMIDEDVTDKSLRPNCKDIALQLFENGININVLLGGGRKHMTSKNETDPEYPKIRGSRTDGRNLIQEWQDKQASLGRRYKYVWNRTEFENVDPSTTDYLLGMFEPEHMKYDHLRPNDTAGEPSLAEMTKMAIQILSKNQNGYFLLVEGGKIDHGHHTGIGRIALHETVAMNKAVKAALDLINPQETLIIVTADHSHTFVMGGYASRTRNILLTTDRDHGNGPGIALDKKPYTILLYGNGPGGKVNGTRDDPAMKDTKAFSYKQQAAIPLKSETHGGEDVPVYATGPMAHLFHRVHEQTYVAHVMMFASCVGPYHNHEHCVSASANIPFAQGALRFFISVQVIVLGLRRVL